MKNKIVRIAEPLDALKQYFGYDSFRGHQFEAIESILDGEDICFYAPTSLGKCFRADTNILMYDGTIKNITQIAVGDQVMGHDSTARTVLSLASGYDTMYEVRPLRGKSYFVNKEHILCLRRTEKWVEPKNRVVKITVEDYLKASNNFKHCHKGFRTSVDFKHQDINKSLDPYFLGLWLGDGSSKDSSITTADQEIVDYLNQYALDKHINKVRVSSKKDNRASTYHLSMGRIGPSCNPIVNGLRVYGILNNKHIPYEYKVNSREVRLHVLAGLLDSDGYLNPKCNAFDYVSKSKTLAEDVVFLAQSLGFYCTLYKCQKVCTNNGKVGTYYRTCISGDVWNIPTKIVRKQAAFSKKRTDWTNIGINIIESEKDNYYGFMTDGDHMFLLDDFTVVHNSIVYQISALCSEGTTIVISPLIALMSDQVDSLVAKGINAVFYNSSLTIKQSRAVLENIQSGTVKLLYVAPETLLNDSFIEILQNLNIQMIFLDEAHVCSSWGHDFRSDYKKLGILRKYFPKAVFAALTATADEITRRDIDVILKFNNHIVFMHSFDRPNISYAAYRKYGKGQDQTLELIQTYPVGTCGIVYCFTRKDTEEMAKYLNSNGIKCLPFHAGLKKSEKELAQSTWMSSETPVIVATIAFGMGIDKAQPLNSKVLTPTGWSTIGELKLNDLVISSDGKPTKVLNINERGLTDSYKVTFNDNTSTICALDHLWNVRTAKDKYRGKNYKTVTTESLIGKLQDSCGNNLYQIPLTAPVEFNKNVLPIDPYILGCLLGDGSIIKSPIRICSTDPFIINEISRLLPPEINIKKYGDIDFGITGKRGSQNQYLDSLRSLKLLGTNSSTKFIPDEYLYSSVQNRFSLLQGLMDTDGSPQGGSKRISTKKVGSIYVTKSFKLKDGIVSLVQSLGGICRVSIKNTFFYIYIRLEDNSKLFKLPRKKDLITPYTKYKPTRSIVSIEKLEASCEMRCITVENTSGLYLTNDYIVTHNCNVRFVIHASMPSSLEGYCQESGRAGRDGLESDAHLIYGPDDYEIAKWVLSQGDVTSKIYSNKMLKLNKVYRFSQADTCRRVLMLSYFGEESLPCQKCDVCDPKIAVKLSPKPVAQVKKTTRRKTVARRSR